MFCKTKNKFAYMSTNLRHIYELFYDQNQIAVKLCGHFGSNVGT